MGVVVSVAVAGLFASTRVALAVLLASTRAALPLAFASTRAVLVEGDDVVLVFPVALIEEAFGPFEVCETLVVFGADAFGPDAFGPDVFGADVLGPAVVVFGEDTLTFDDTCCGFGVDPFLPCAGSEVDEASTNATVETNAITVRVIDPPEGHAPRDS